MMLNFDVTRTPDYFGIVGFFLWASVERWFHLSGRQQVGGQRRDRGTYWLITGFWYAAVLVSISDSFCFFWTPPGLPLRGLRWLGVLLVTTGLVLRIASRRDLGRQYSYLVETSNNHRLVKDGVYRKLRHPAYLGSLNLLVGIPLSLLSVPGLAIALIGGIPAVVYRIRIEENALLERFGSEYEAYAKDTWRILPNIW